MRIIWFVILVLAASAAAAHADPVTGIVSLLGVIGVVGETATIIAGFIITTAISVLARAIIGGQSTRRPGINTPLILTGDVNPERFILGTYATAGQIVYPALTHNANHNKVFVIAVCSKPGAALKRISIDGAWVPITATVDPNYGNVIGGKYLNKAYVKFYDGTQTVVDPMMAANYGAHPDYPYTGDMVGQGICYAIVTVVYDATLFPSFPEFLFEIDGIPLYDPRLDTTAGGVGTQRWADSTTWARTANPIVMEYNILRGITTHSGDIWGAQAMAQDLPFAIWAAAMDICDEQVSDGAGGFEPRYIAGIEISLDQTPADILSLIGNSCAASLADVGGVWQVKSGVPAQPTIFATDDDIIITSPQTKSPVVSLQNTHNAVGASYVDAQASYSATDAPLYSNLVALAEDKGRQRVATVDLSTVTRITQVGRLQAAYLADDRQWVKHTMDIPARVAGIEPFDVMSWSSTANSYTAQPFEVVQTTFDPVRLTSTVALRKINYADWQ